MTQPTHGIIDKDIHRVTEIVPADHPMHTHSHRVKFACGLSFDLRGVRQALVQDHRRAVEEAKRFGMKHHHEAVAELAEKLSLLDPDHDLHAIVAAHSATPDDLNAKFVEHPDVMLSRETANAAGQKLCEIRERFFPKRDEWEATRVEHGEVTGLIVAATEMAVNNSPLVATLGAAYLDALYDRHKRTTLKILELRPDWESVRREEELAVEMHGRETAKHHETRAKHERDKRWIVSETDVTTCPGCKEVV